MSYAKRAQNGTRITYSSLLAPPHILIVRASWRRSLSAGVHPMSRDHSQGLTSIYVLLLMGVGICSGAAMGSMLEGVMHSGVLIGLISGLGAVAVTGWARGLAVKVFPDGTVPDVGADKFPRVVLINILVVSLIGGLAGHDLSHETGESTGFMIGALSVLFATLAMLVSMATYFYRGKEAAFTSIAANPSVLPQSPAIGLK